MTHKNGDLEAALWSALRALEENAALRRRMAERAEKSNWQPIVQRYKEQAEDSEARAAVLRRLLVGEEREARKMRGIRPSRANRDKDIDHVVQRAVPLAKTSAKRRSKAARRRRIGGSM